MGVFARASEGKEEVSPLIILSERIHDHSKVWFDFGHTVCHCTHSTDRSMFLCGPCYLLFVYCTLVVFDYN